MKPILTPFFWSRGVVLLHVAAAGPHDGPVHTATGDFDPDPCRSYPASTIGGLFEEIQESEHVLWMRFLVDAEDILAFIDDRWVVWGH